MNIFERKGEIGYMEIGKTIDIFLTCYLRQFYTEQTITYLKERTTHPFRLIVIDNGGNDEVLEKAVDVVFLRVKMMHNAGIHAAWNVALALAESEYFITTDNDIYAPKLDPDWLTQLITFMNERPNYGAISLCPHVFIGASGIDPQDPEDVKERNMAGAVLRILRTEAVRKAGGWEHVLRTGRNHEESTICSRLQSIGYKVGICSRIRAYHPFGKGIPDQSGWGYPKDFGPEKQGHRAEIKDYVLDFDKPEAYDENTWLPLK